MQKNDNYWTLFYTGIAYIERFYHCDRASWHPVRRILLLKGKGLPEFGNSRHGDLYLRIVVQVPERLSCEERELYERFHAIGGKVH